MTERAEPVRTCIGCRDRVAKSDLLRVVAVGDGSGASRVAPDPRGSQPGRGAHLHPTPDCLALAERRKAFGRALRLANPVDVAAVRDYVAGQPHTGPVRGESNDECSMSQQR